MATIILDPGHGGRDCGAVNMANGAKESDSTRVFAARVKTVLEARGHTVILPFWHDLPSEAAPFRMPARAAWINEKHPAANLVLSIHLNACDSHEAKGTECYYASVAGRAIAERVCGAACLGDTTRNRGAKKGQWAILTKTRPVSILLECAFIDNYGDYAWWLENRYRQAFSVAEVLDLIFRG